MRRLRREGRERCPIPRSASPSAQMDCTVGETEPNLNKIGISPGGGDARRGPGHLSRNARRLAISSATDREAGGGAGRPDREGARRHRRRNNHLPPRRGLYTATAATICNSQQLFSPDGKCLATYDKAHLFAAERNWYQRGRPGDCGRHQTRQDGHDHLLRPALSRICPASGRSRRGHYCQQHELDQRPLSAGHWGWTGERVQALVSTRALENVSFVAMSCRVGHEVAAPDLEFDSFGHSCIASPSGKMLASLGNGEGIAIAQSTSPRPILIAGGASPPTGWIGVRNSIAETETHRDHVESWVSCRVRDRCRNASPNVRDDLSKIS